jgi:hypothetical protein
MVLRSVLVARMSKDDLPKFSSRIRGLQAKDLVAYRASNNADSSKPPTVLRYLFAYGKHHLSMSISLLFVDH